MTRGAMNFATRVLGKGRGPEDFVQSMRAVYRRRAAVAYSPSDYLHRILLFGIYSGPSSRTDALRVWPRCLVLLRNLDSPFAASGPAPAATSALTTSTGTSCAVKCGAWGCSGPSPRPRTCWGPCTCR